ncbi:MAG: hypothetical protein RL354_1491, partial [Planctomycetota bacterium]
MGDRAIQFLAALVAIAALALAGAIQPTLVEMASEPYLDVSVAKDGSAERAMRRVPIAAIRSIDTRRGMTAGAEVKVDFPGRAEGWNGRVGDEIL